MGSSYAVHRPSTTPRSLHVVHRTISDEEAPPYDGKAPIERVRLTVVETAVVRDVCRDCGTAAAMYFLLESYADADGRCFPSYDTLAEGLDVTRRQAIRLVAKLEAAGYVFISERRTARKHNQSNLYTLPYHRKSRNGGGDITGDISGDTTSDTSGAPESPKVVVSSREVVGSKKTPPTPSKGVSDRAFDEFWDRWPKKVAKLDAQKAWAKIKPGPMEVRAILERADLLARITPPDRIRFIPNPATFLNGRRWEDAPPRSEIPGAPVVGKERESPASAAKRAAELQTVIREMERTNAPGWKIDATRRDLKKVQEAMEITA
jgi:hypothetical protein